MVEINVLEMLQQTNPEFSMPGVGQQFQGDRSSKNTRVLTYWKKCTGEYKDQMCQSHGDDLGWIMVGPWPNRFTMYEVQEFELAKHATRLDDKYIQPPVEDPSRLVTNELKNPITRFAPLIRNGGIHEMPLEQMIAYNWHRLPVFRKEFPELEKVVDIPCEFGCALKGRNARIFTSVDGYRQHVKIVHSDVQAPKAIGEVIKEAINAINKVK